MADIWRDAPGSRSSTSIIKKLVVSFGVGVLSVGLAWAGAGVVPVDKFVGRDQKKVRSATASGNSNDKLVGIEVAEAAQGESFEAAALEPLQAGQLYAGSAKVSLYPRPEDYVSPPSRMQHGSRDQEQVRNHDPERKRRLRDRNSRSRLQGALGRKPQLPLYGRLRHRSGQLDHRLGRGIRTLGPIHRHAGLQGDTVVLTLIDAVYWEAHLNNLCPGDPCGLIDIAQQLSEETGLPATSFIFASTHSHTAMDFIGGWGGVPDWYMQQATDSLKASALQALASMEPAVLEAGESIVRERNGERRRVLPFC